MVFHSNSKYGNICDGFNLHLSETCIPQQFQNEISVLANLLLPFRQDVQIKYHAYTPDSAVLHQRSCDVCESLRWRRQTEWQYAELIYLLPPWKSKEPAVIPVHQDRKELVLQVYGDGPIAVTNGLVHLLESGHIEMFFSVCTRSTALDWSLVSSPFLFWHWEKVGEKTLAGCVHELVL